MIGLKFICMIKNIEYIEIAKYLGLAKSNVTDWLYARRSVPEKHLERLSQYLEIKKEYIERWLTYDQMIEILNEFKENKNLRM